MGGQDMDQNVEKNERNPNQKRKTRENGYFRKKGNRSKYALVRGKKKQISLMF